MLDYSLLWQRCLKALVAHLSQWRLLRRELPLPMSALVHRSSPLLAPTEQQNRGEEGGLDVVDLTGWPAYDAEQRRLVVHERHEMRAEVHAQMMS